MERETTGLYHEIKEKLRTYLESRLSRLWEEGSSGADFFIAAIGSAIEVFGRYETVIDFEGNVVRANALLDDIREIVTGYALGQIFEEGVAADISDLTRLYVLWRWEFGEARVHFDDARKLAQSCGIDLSLEWDRNGFIRKEKEFVRFIGPQDRRFEDLENPNELIDALHLALRQWEKGKVDEMTTGLSEAGFGGETFFRVAQAISQTLPNESKEKKLLDGFLAGRERVREEVRRKTVQTRLM
jgi:adenine-specific DNA methylase